MQNLQCVCTLTRITGGVLSSFSCLFVRELLLLDDLVLGRKMFYKKQQLKAQMWVKNAPNQSDFITSSHLILMQLQRDWIPSVWSSPGFELSAPRERSFNPPRCFQVKQSRIISNLFQMQKRQKKQLPALYSIYLNSQKNRTHRRFVLKWHEWTNYWCFYFTKQEIILLRT